MLKRKFISTFFVFFILVQLCSCASIHRNRKYNSELSQSITFALGMGSAVNGLETISLKKNTLHLTRIVNNRFWEEAIIELNDTHVNEMLRIIVNSGVLNLNNAYAKPDTFDGEQWIFYYNNEERGIKIIYCNNYFPGEMVALSVKVEQFIDNRFTNLKWKKFLDLNTIPKYTVLEHNKFLWNAIKKDPKAKL